MSTTLNRDSLLSFANSHRDEYESLLRRFVELPTVSVDPNHLEDIKKGVEQVIQLARELGDQFRAAGVRLDSGDLANHARRVRGQLDAAGLS